jgi:hypothetical protein
MVEKRKCGWFQRCTIKKRHAKPTTVKTKLKKQVEMPGMTLNQNTASDFRVANNTPDYNFGGINQRGFALDAINRQLTQKQVAYAVPGGGVLYFTADRSVPVKEAKKKKGVPGVADGVAVAADGGVAPPEAVPPPQPASPQSPPMPQPFTFDPAPMPFASAAELAMAAINAQYRAEGRQELEFQPYAPGVSGPDIRRGKKKRVRTPIDTAATPQTPEQPTTVAPQAHASSAATRELAAVAYDGGSEDDEAQLVRPPKYTRRADRNRQMAQDVGMALQRVAEEEEAEALGDRDAQQVLADADADADRDAALADADADAERDAAEADDAHLALTVANEQAAAVENHPGAIFRSEDDPDPYADDSEPDDSSVLGFISRIFATPAKRNHDAAWGTLTPKDKALFRSKESYEQSQSAHKRFTGKD